jgi:hypothetical protein
MPFAALLVALTGPVVIRAMIALGLGVITYVGFSALVSTVTGYVQSSYASLPLAALQLLALGGWNTAIGILLGAFATRVALISASRLGRVAA